MLRISTLLRLSSFNPAPKVRKNIYTLAIVLVPLLVLAGLVVGGITAHVLHIVAAALALCSSALASLNVDTWSQEMTDTATTIQEEEFFDWRHRGRADPHDYDFEGVFEVRETVNDVTWSFNRRPLELKFRDFSDEEWDRLAAFIELEVLDALDEAMEDMESAADLWKGYYPDWWQSGDHSQ